MGCPLEELPFDPGLLVEPADGGHDGQEEQAEHEIGGRAQPLVQEVTHIQEQKGGHYDHETPGREHQDGAEVVHLLELVPRFGRLGRHGSFLLSLGSSGAAPGTAPFLFFLQLTRVLTASMTGLVNRAMRTV